MLNLTCQQNNRQHEAPVLTFEIRDCSASSRPALRLPCELTSTQKARFKYQPFVALEARKGCKVAPQRRQRQQSCQQPCFASLLQGFSKHKSESKPQAAEPKNDAAATLQSAAGWSKHLLCGALSAVVSRTTMAPLERIKLEIVLHKRQETMFEVALGVLERDGTQGFWKGNGINLLRTAPYKVSHTVTRMSRTILLSELHIQSKGGRKSNSICIHEICPVMCHHWHFLSLLATDKIYSIADWCRLSTSSPMTCIAKLFCGCLATRTSLIEPSALSLVL